MQHPSRGARGQAGHLGELLESREGAPYPAYRDIQGRYAIGPGVLDILHVQPDPFASPSRLRISVPTGDAGFD